MSVATYSAAVHSQADAKYPPGGQGGNEVNINFKFAPRQRVVVTAFGLNYHGRINRCVFDGGPLLYNVEYAFDGKVETREFYEDELKADPENIRPADTEAAHA
jgi:hypothetical protein